MDLYKLEYEHKDKSIVTYYVETNISCHLPKINGAILAQQPNLSLKRITHTGTERRFMGADTELRAWKVE